MMFFGGLSRLSGLSWNSIKNDQKDSKIVLFCIFRWNRLIVLVVKLISRSLLRLFLLTMPNECQVHRAVTPARKGEPCSMNVCCRKAKTTPRRWSWSRVITSLTRLIIKVGLEFILGEILPRFFPTNLFFLSKSISVNPIAFFQCVFGHHSWNASPWKNGGKW